MPSNSLAWILLIALVLMGRVRRVGPDGRMVIAMIAVIASLALHLTEFAFGVRDISALGRILNVNAIHVRHHREMEVQVIVAK